MSARALTLLVLALLLTAPCAADVVSCSTTAVGPAFGIYAQLSPTPLNSNGSVTVACTLISGNPPWVAAEVKLSAGSSGSYAARTMQFGAQQLAYNLYLDAAYSQVWGDTSGGSSDWTAIIKVNPGHVNDQATGVIYGQIPAAQDPGSGVYLDTIVVTVNY
jgi:spore coat protein U-like protein